uniref:RRM domain-containing protein n=1 Tax=Ditylenchus dipsaci TaxID=166011 RepID=A0A915EAR7_9BILA
MVTNESSLSNFFSQFGQVVDCVVMRNEEQRSKGFGFVHWLPRISLPRLLVLFRTLLMASMHDVVPIVSIWWVSLPSIPKAKSPITSGVSEASLKSTLSKDRETGMRVALLSCISLITVQGQVLGAAFSQHRKHYQQQQGGFVARTPKTRGAFRSQPYPSGRNAGYNNQTYGSPAGGAFPGAMQQYQTGYSGYAGSPATGGGYPPAGGYNTQMWPPTGQPYGMPSSAPVQPMSSWGAGGTSVPDVNQLAEWVSRAPAPIRRLRRGVANQPKNFENNQYY